MKFKNDRYWLVQELHAKAACQVCLVEDRNTGKKYVAKILNVTEATPVQIHQFKMEIDVLSRLSDPHIPQLVEVYYEENQMCLIETYLYGVDLNTWKQIHKRKYLFVRKRFLIQLMNLLSNLHDLGILYVDIKPENLMIIQDHVYLIDFDSCIPCGSYRVNSISRSNIAPETYDACRKEESIDIYALGTLANTMYRKGLKRLWIQKCMRQDPKKRYRSISKAKRALNRIHLLGKLIPLLLIIDLSVFFQWGIGFPKEDLIERYQIEASREEGSRQEKAQNLLYYWIIQDVFQDHDFKDLETARFFLNQALVSGNTYIVHDIYQRIPENIKEQLPIQTKISMYMSEKEIDYSSLKKIIKQISKEDHGLNQLLHLSQVEKMLLEKEIALEIKERQTIMKIFEQWNTTEMEEDIETFHEILNVHLEYALYLKSQGIGDLIPASWEKLIEDDKDLKSLYRILR